MRTFVLIALLAAQRAAPPPQDSGTVTGQIRSTPGASIAGIRIAAMVAPAPGTAATEPATLVRLTTTDNDGRFRLENIQPGRYYITAGFVDAPTYFPGVLKVADARIRQGPDRSTDHEGFEKRRPKISIQHSPIADLENPFAISLINSYPTLRDFYR